MSHNPCDLDESKGALRTKAGRSEAMSEPQAKHKQFAKIGLGVVLDGAIYDSNEVSEVRWGDSSLFC